jgi:hypothetical protein
MNDQGESGYQYILAQARETTEEPPRWWDLPPGTPTADVATAFSTYQRWSVDQGLRVKRMIEHRRRQRPRPYTIHPITGVKTWSR